MNRLYLIIISCFILKVASSQSISPAQTGEYCPETEYTFTATIPKTYQSMIGVGGCYVTQPPTPPVGSTFTFKGKFADANQKQSFKIYYTDGTSYDFEFKKIKSLYFTTSCALVPNQAPKTVPRCEIVNIPIIVSNVQWGTNFETPTLCFGSISNFEYQLPPNWSIGASVSTGTNWIPGGNSVTVTSDLSGGNNSSILVRPRNTCASGLQNGQAPGQIPISRPAPSLSVSSNKTILCTINELASFTINGLSGGASVTWSLPNANGNAVIDGCSTCPTINVKKLADYAGFIDVIATVTDCSTTYPSVSKQIALGNPVTITSSLNGCNGVYQIWNMNNNQPTFGSNWYWSVSYLGNNSQITIYTPGAPSTMLSVKGGGAVNLDFIDGCGIPRQYGMIVYSTCYSYSYRVSVSPNPAKNNLLVSLDSLKNKNYTVKDETIISLYEINSNTLVKQWKYKDMTIEQFNLNITGIRKGLYFLQVNRANEISGTKVLIE